MGEREGLAIAKRIAAIHLEMDLLPVGIIGEPRAGDDGIMTGQARTSEDPVGRNDKAGRRRRDNFVSTRDIMGPYTGLSVSGDHTVDCRNGSMPRI